MTAVLIFLGALVAIVVFGFVVSRVRGGRAHYLDAWTPDAGERTLHEDRAADFYVVARLGQARKMSFARLHRTHAVLTSTRIVIATRALLSKRYMITHMVYLAGRGDGPAELASLTGGLGTTGYSVISAQPGAMTVEDDGRRAYLRIVPDQTASGAMIEHCRLYSDDAQGFRDAAASP